jgi:hypothetical protein
MNDKLLEPEKIFIKKSIEQIIELASNNKLTKSKCNDILERVLIKGYTTGYNDGWYDGADDTCADENGNFYHTDNARCRF